MRKIILFVFLIFTVIYGQNQNKLIADNAEIDSFKVLHPTSLHPKINTIVTSLLLRNHYKKTNLNDSLSEIIYKNYH